jgi:hypothetical protein
MLAQLTRREFTVLARSLLTGSKKQPAAANVRRHVAHVRRGIFEPMGGLLSSARR